MEVGKDRDEQSLLAELEAKYGAEATKAARRLLEWGRSHMPETFWGYSSFIPGLTHNGIWHQVFRAYSQQW